MVKPASNSRSLKQRDDRSALANWWTTTTAERWLHLSLGALDHFHFWDHTDASDEEDLK